MTANLLAAITNPVIPAVIGSGNTANGPMVIGNIVGSVIGAILIIAFLLSMFYLLTGGVSWITSAGDKTQLENARNKITNAIIGLMVVAAVWAVSSLIGPWLGIGFPKLNFPTIEGTANQDLINSISKPFVPKTP